MATGLIEVTTGTPDGTVLESGNTVFTQVLGGATFAATTTDVAVGTVAGLLTFTAASQAKQGVLTFPTATDRVSVVLTRKRETTAKTATSNLFRLYAGSTALVQIYERTDGFLRVDLGSPAATVFTSTGVIPAGWHRIHVWADQGATASTGTFHVDVYAGATSTTPLAGLSFATDAAALGTTTFTSFQALRPGASTDVGAERWLPIRWKTAADAATKDVAGFSTGTPPGVTAGAPVTRTSVTFAGTGLTLSSMALTPPVTGGVTVSGMTVSWLEDGTRTTDSTLTGVLTGPGGQTPINVTVPAVVGEGETTTVRVGELVRISGVWH